MNARRNQIHEANRKKGENDKFNAKATFAAGALMVISMIKSILGLFIELTNIHLAIFLGVGLVIYAVIMCTHKFDKKLCDKKHQNAANVLTVLSIVVFFVDNTLLIGFLFKVIIIIIYIVILGSVLYLLRAKY